MPSGNYPQYLVVSELSRRTAMEKQFAGIAAQQNQPQETVADKTVREATPMPMAAMQGLKSPQTDFQEEPSGQETMGIPSAVRMFEGGRVAFKDGGDTIYDRAMSGIRSFFGGKRKVPSDIPYGTPEYYEALYAAKQKEIEKDPGGIFGVALPGKVKQLERIKQKLEESKRKPTTTAITERFPVIGKIDTLERTLKDVNAQLEGLSEDDPKRESLMKIKTQTENQLRERFREGQSPADIKTPVIDQVDKDQANRKKQLQKEADQSATKEKDALSEFERLSKEKYEMPELKSTLNTDEAFKLLGDAPTEKTFENVMKDLSNARQEDFLKVVEENTNKMQDGIDKEKRQAIPMSLISAGLAIASAPSGSGLLGAITEGAKAGFSKFEGLQKDIKSSEKAFRDAQNALAMAKDARQEGDMKTAREQVNRYEDKMESYKDKQVNINMEVQKQLASNDQLRYQTEVQMLNSERNRELEMAKKRYERAASDKQARAALAAEHDMKINEAIMTLNQYKLEVRSNTLMDDEQKAIAIAEANAQINAYRGINIEDDVEKKKEGGTIKAPKNNSYRSVFDFT
jgi:hypothetical protein